MKVKKLFSDNGGEYIADDFDLFCHHNCIETLHTSAHTPVQNGICERYNRTLVEALRTVLLTSRMARTLFGVKFIMSITYVQNHLPHVTYGGSPWNCTEGLWLRTLGCGCHTMLDIEEQEKLLITANLSTLLG